MALPLALRVDSNPTPGVALLSETSPSTVTAMIIVCRRRCVVEEPPRRGAVRASMYVQAAQVYSAQVLLVSVIPSCRFQVVIYSNYHYVAWEFVLAIVVRYIEFSYPVTPHRTIV